MQKVKKNEFIGDFLQCVHWLNDLYLHPDCFYLNKYINVLFFIGGILEFPPLIYRKSK